MNRRALVVSLLVSLGFVGATSAAATDNEPWQLRIRGAWVDPNFDYRMVEDDASEVHAVTDGDFGYGLGLEYRVNDLVGIEVAGLRSNPAVDLTLIEPWGDRYDASGDLRSLMLTAGVNFHLTPDAPVDVFVGALAAWVDFGDLGFSVETESVNFSVADDWGWGATIGLDVPMGESGWSVNAGVSYIDLSLDTTNVVENEHTPALSFDTLVGTIGVGYRF